MKNLTDSRRGFCRRLGAYGAALLLATGLLPACQTYDDYLPEPATVQTLSVSTTTPVLSQANADNTALTFAWTRGSNEGTGAAIDYTLQLALRGSNFATPAEVALSRSATSLAYTSNAFNTLLIDKLKLPLGTAQTVEVRLKAQEASGQKAPTYSNVVTVTATPYQSVTTLWIVGDATPRGWDIGNAEELRRSPTDAAVFTYSEVLKAGEFKIATVRDFGAPFYRPTTSNAPLSSTAVQLSAGEPDHKWKITTPGPYRITLNIRTMSISIVPFQAPAQLWLVGSATPNGWDIGKATPLTVSPTNPTIFTYTGPFVVGEFKIATEKNFDAPFYRPLTNRPDLSATGVQLTAGSSPDEKWEITAATAGTHTITLDVLRQTISIK